ncbi:MAG: hypothetical protein ACOYD4_03940 [Solirubrobacterales bacterium]
MRIPLFERVRHIPHGVEVITKWLGSGGQVVDREESQARADICNGKKSGTPCEHNVHGEPVTKAVALAVKQFLAIKSSISLRVDGEKSLGTCKVCGCVLRLQVHEPQDKVFRELSEEEIATLPDHCWKLKAPCKS